MLFKDGSDVMIDHLITKEQLALALAEACSILVGQVFIVGDPDECPDLDSHIKIMCKLYHMIGDFPIHLSINVFNPYIRNLELGITMQKFSEKLKCKCLIDDGSLDPYSMLLVDGLNDMYQVSIDEVSEDPEIFGYVIVSEKSDSSSTDSQ